MTTVNLVKTHDVFIGIDTDKISFSFTIKDHNNMKQSKKIPANPEHFYNYIQNNFTHKNVICAYEAGPTGFGLYDYLKEKQIPCLIVPPLSIPKASNESVKTNRIDSNKIAQHLMSGEMKSIRVPEGAYRELRHLVSSRENYAHLRKTSMQRIKALLLYANLYPFIKDTDSNWSYKYIKELKQIPCSEACHSRLDMLIQDLEYARKQILSIHKTIRIFCRENSEINQYVQYLTSIPGIGFIIATAILGKIGDPKNLKNPRELAAFIGLVPCEHSTGDTINKGSITHLGDKALRFLLVEAAWVTIRYNKQLEQFYHRIKKRHHPSIASKKAIVAVARKLTQIIYRVLKDQRNYVAYKN